YPAPCAFLPLCSRLLFAAMPLLGTFTEVYAGHMRIGPEGKAGEDGLTHGSGEGFRRRSLTFTGRSPYLVRPSTVVYPCAIRGLSVQTTDGTRMAHGWHTDKPRMAHG